MSCRFRVSPTLTTLAAALFLPSFFALHPAATAADIEKAKGTAAGTNGFRPLVAADRLSTPLLAPASNEGEARIKQFRHVPGLKIELWAAEPMLANPVAFSVDEQGRVYTSETYRYRSSVLDIRHYMFMLEDDLASRSLEDRLANIRKWFGPDGEQQLSQETEVIRLLEDTDHDGKADKSSIFADGLNSPLDGIASGVLARRGEVWFTDIPSVWKFSPSPPSKDAAPAPRTPLASSPRAMDGYQATELLRGFGVRFSFTGHDLHGLKFGPDGRLYFSVGDRGAHIVTQEGTVIDLPDEGAVFRCEPDGSKLEVVHRGLRNPQELAFNEYGDLFSGDNDSDQGDRERWVQIIEGADSGWRVGYQHAPLGNAGPWNMERLWVPHFDGQAAYIIPPIANIGDGPSGLVYDYGTSLPAGLTNRFLLAYFKGTSAKSGLFSLRNRPAGAGYELVAHDEFVWNALVPDVDLGPDGSIWFADWHEGWPKSNKGRLYRAYFPEVIADPVVQETAKLLAEGMTKRSETELLALLAHRDMRVRQDAQFELAGRGPKSFDGLKKVAFESKNQLARIHAIWGIGQIARAASRSQFAEELESLLPLTRAADAEIRSATVRVLGAGRVVKLDRELDRLLVDPSPKVRFNTLLASREMRIGMMHPDAGRRFFRYAKTGTDKVSDMTEEVFGRRLTEAPGGQRAHGTAVHQLLEQSGSDVLLRHALGLWFASWLPPEPMVDGQLRSMGWPEMAHERADVRMPFLMAERHRRDSSITNFLSDSDPLLVLEAARAINDVPITNALPALATLAEPAQLDALLKQFAALTLSETGKMPVPLAIRDVRADQPLPWGDAPIDQLTPMLLRVVNANFRVGTPQSTQRLAALATRTDLSELIRTEAIRALATWAKPPPRDRIVGTYRPLPPRDAAPAHDALSQALPTLLARSSRREEAPSSQTPDPKPKARSDQSLVTSAATGEVLLAAAAEAVAALQLTEAAPQLAALVKDTGAPAAARAAALRAFSQINHQPGEVQPLLAFAAKDSAEPLRLAASKLNAELNPNDAAGQLAAKLASGSLAEQQSAYASLGDLKSDTADALLTDALDRLMKREVANEVMLDLVEAAGKRDASAVKTRLAAYQDWKLPKDHLSPYREALFGGDAARGKKIFYENAAVACTRCHQIGTDGGGNAGPKLDGVATRQPREYLLESVVAPNQQVTEGFETAIITLNDGQSYAGIVKSENDTDLVILAPEEGDVTLKKANVKSREKGLSGMPDGMGQLLTRQELRDVMEFLGTLK